MVPDEDLFRHVVENLDRDVHTGRNARVKPRLVLLLLAIGPKEGEELVAQRLADPERDVADPGVLLGAWRRHRIGPREQSSEGVETIGGGRRREVDELVRVVDPG